MTSLFAAMFNTLRSIALGFMGQEAGVRDQVAIRVRVEDQRRNPLNLR